MAGCVEVGGFLFVVGRWVSMQAMQAGCVRAGGRGGRVESPRRELRGGRLCVYGLFGAEDAGWAGSIRLVLRLLFVLQ
jgi:hypothetical protein